MVSLSVVLCNYLYASKYILRSLWVTSLINSQILITEVSRGWTELRLNSKQESRKEKLSLTKAEESSMENWDFWVRDSWLLFCLSIIWVIRLLTFSFVVSVTNLGLGTLCAYLDLVVAYNQFVLFSVGDLSSALWSTVLFKLLNFVFKSPKSLIFVLILLNFICF